MAFATGAARKVNGMGRTVVIAGKTGRAQPVVTPPRQLALGALDIAHWTHLPALAASQANLGIDRELGIGDPMLDKE